MIKILSKQINLPKNILEKLKEEDFEKDIKKFVDLFPINIEMINKNYFNPNLDLGVE